jgi:hypothetical protein
MTQTTPISQNIFDREPVPAAAIRDLDLALVFKTIQQGLDLRRFSLDEVPGLTAEALRAGSEEAAQRYLERYGGAVWLAQPGQEPRLALTIAGLLAFTKPPDQWVRGSRLDLAHY